MCRELLDRLQKGLPPSAGVLKKFLTTADEDEKDILFRTARETRDRMYGRRAFLRGLIEFSSYCSQDCLYCGLRRSNENAARYRLTKDEIYDRCALGYSLGYRSFVLQSGEDGYFDDDRSVDIVRSIRERFRDCAITLSMGERSRESYIKLRDAGADRYLLRHETADEAHFAHLHPPSQKLSSRLIALKDLKDAGYQVGAGFMVGSPGQTYETISKDLELISRLRPHMVGVGPFIPHHDTPFAGHPAGSADMTIVLLAIIRILIPDVLLPATTALATLDGRNRIKALDAGANVIMPNLSPPETRNKYSIYDGKKSSGAEAAESLASIVDELRDAGYVPDMTRGDHIKISP